MQLTWNRVSRGLQCATSFTPCLINSCIPRLMPMPTPAPCSALAEEPASSLSFEAASVSSCPSVSGYVCVYVCACFTSCLISGCFLLISYVYFYWRWFLFLRRMWYFIQLQFQLGYRAKRRPVIVSVRTTTVSINIISLFLRFLHASTFTMRQKARTGTGS